MLNNLTSLSLSYSTNQVDSEFCILEYLIKYKNSHWLITTLSIQTHLQSLRIQTEEADTSVIFF